MFKLFSGFLAGILVGYLLGLVIPDEIFFIACILLLSLIPLFILLLHFGLRDFQEY